MAETPDSPLRLRYAAVSDVGRHRKENQDSGYASEHLLVVADGVGGAAYGDVASSTAVHLLRRLDRPDVSEMLPALAGAVHRVHDRLAEMVEQDQELDGTSTTVTAALFDGRRLGFVHVGDSRAYLFRDGAVAQLTTDHTFVQTLIDEGRISEDEARVHPHRNIILRAVDGSSDTDPDLFELDAQPGDRLVLCSDGCSGAVTDAELTELLTGSTVDSAAYSLVQRALDNGTTDNVTVIVAEVVDAGTTDDPDTTAAATTGPMLVGAAVEQPRRGGMLGGGFGVGGLFRRQHDTGELDPVPAEEEPVDPEALRYAPRAPRRRGGLRRLLYVVLPLLLVAGVLAGAYQWSQDQYYVAADGPQVAIYRGVQLDLPWVDLSSVYEAKSLQVDDLRPADQDSLADGIEARSLDHAERIVEELAQAACSAAQKGGSTTGPSEEPAPDPSASPTRKPRSSPSREAGRNQQATNRPDGSRTPEPTRSPTGSPTGSPTATPDPDETTTVTACVENEQP
ncbi:PP2C family protein-serine/threonine phosphatase [Nocardioides caldifontis]|uniref:PP2C family protein-serine/threonine phosphatase n=1 Tax=Nocardioides caldifontis TaxID=2588938 RepID=UPI001939FCAC|nr:PP2C family serine/threonine-protein phosphatase [Nocardioides caldifontis]